MVWEVPPLNTLQEKDKVQRERGSNISMNPVVPCFGYTSLGDNSLVYRSIYLSIVWHLVPQGDGYDRRASTSSYPYTPSLLVQSLPVIKPYKNHMLDNAAHDTVLSLPPLHQSFCKREHRGEGSQTHHSVPFIVFHETKGLQWYNSCSPTTRLIPTKNTDMK